MATKEPLKKAGEIYVEGMKTAGQDLGGMVMGNMPRKRGIMGRLKQAAAIGATMITLGGIGSIKTTIQNHQADKVSKANVEYMEKAHGWMLSASANDQLWSIDGNTHIQNMKQQQEHQTFLFNMASYLKVYLTESNPSKGEKLMMDKMNAKLASLKEGIAQGDEGALKNYQFNQLIQKELLKVMKRANQEGSELGKKQYIKDTLKDINNNQTKIMINTRSRGQVADF